MRVGVPAVITGEDADGQASLADGTPAGGFHHAAESPADEYRASPGYLTADLFGNRLDFGETSPPPMTAISTISSFK